MLSLGVGESKMSGSHSVVKRPGAGLGKPSSIEAEFELRMAQIRQQIHDAADTMIATMTAAPAAGVAPIVEQGARQIVVETPALDASDIRSPESLSKSYGTSISATITHLQTLMISGRYRKTRS